MAEILSASVIRFEVESGGFPTGNYFRGRSRLRRRLLARDVREIGFPGVRKNDEIRPGSCPDELSSLFSHQNWALAAGLSPWMR
jgi:hypothetical protein